MNDKMKARVAALTPRQREVARLISLGCTDSEMADILGIAPDTVENHRTRVMKALAIRKSVLLARVAIKYRISKLDDRLTPSERRKRGARRDGWN